MGCHSLLQGILPTQGSNPGLQLCRQLLYHVRHRILLLNVAEKNPNPSERVPEGTSNTEELNKGDEKGGDEIKACGDPAKDRKHTEKCCFLLLYINSHI